MSSNSTACCRSGAGRCRRCRRSPPRGRRRLMVCTRRRRRSCASQARRSCLRIRFCFRRSLLRRLCGRFFMAVSMCHSRSLGRCSFTPLSCPAHAGHPVTTDGMDETLRFASSRFAVTGSPVEPGDDKEAFVAPTIPSTAAASPEAASPRPECRWRRRWRKRWRRRRR